MTQAKAQCEQLILDIFEPQSFDNIISQKAISNLAVTVSARMRRGWHVKCDMKTGMRNLVVPAWMEHSPDHVKQALIDWALLLCHSRKHNRNNVKKKELEHVVQEYIQTSGINTRNKSRIDRTTFVTQGKKYDLAEVFSSVNNQYFQGSLVSYVRWGKHRLRSFQTTKLDSQGNKVNIITIATLYNRPDVPRFAIEAIMHHEMLHIAIPPYRRGTRNIIHGPEFKKKEQSFPFYKQWLTWEKGLYAINSPVRKKRRFFFL